MKRAATLTSKGQITIPSSVRKALKLNTGDQVLFEFEEGAEAPVVHLQRAPDFFALAGSMPPKRTASSSWAEERRLAREEHARGRRA